MLDSLADATRLIRIIAVMTKQERTGLHPPRQYNEVVANAFIERGLIPMYLHEQKNSGATVRRFRLYACLLVTVILVFATWRRYSNWPSIFDIALWDESIYMITGRSHTFNFSSYEGHPLYSFYYYLLSMLVPDQINLFFIGGLTVQVITLAVVGIAAWMLSKSTAIATLLFGLILCSRFLLSPVRNSYLPVALVMLGCSFAALESHLANRLALTMLVALIVSFIRPELVLGFYLAALALLVVLIGRTILNGYRVVANGRAQEGAQSIYRLTAYLFLTGLLCLTWSFPKLQGSGHAMYAFEQWYAFYWVSEHNSLLNPWLNFKMIVQQVFPGATTPIQAIFSNPSEWMAFTLHNIRGAIPNMGSLLLVRDIGHSGAGGLPNVIIVVGLLVLVSISGWSMYKRARRIGLSSTPRRVPLLESGLYAAAPFTVIVFIQPDPRYALLLLAPLICCFVAIGQWHPWSKQTDTLIAVLAAAVIAVAVRPLPIVDQPTLKAIIALRTLNLPIQKMYELDGGWCFYLNPPCTQVWDFDLPTPPNSLSDAIEKKRVDTIMVSEPLLNFLRGHHDQSLDFFNRNLDGTGWRRYDIGEELYLLHRETSP